MSSGCTESLMLCFRPPHTLRQPGITVRSKDGHYSTTQWQLYTLVPLYSWIIWTVRKGQTNNGSVRSGNNSTVLLNSTRIGAKTQIDDPRRTTQTRLTESVTLRGSGSSHLSSRHGKHQGHFINSALLQKRSVLKGLCGTGVDYWWDVARHRCARLVRSCRLLSSLKGPVRPCSWRCRPQGGANALHSCSEPALKFPRQAKLTWSTFSDNNVCQ